MDKQYKYVPVTDMTFWQLGQAVSKGGEFYDANGGLIRISNTYLNSDSFSQAGIYKQVIDGEITTRQPIPWHEIKDNYPCLASITYDTGKCSPVLLHDIDEFNAYNDPYTHVRVVGIRFVVRLCDIEGYCTPLSPEQAAEYGVECED